MAVSTCRLAAPTSPFRPVSSWKCVANSVGAPITCSRETGIGAHYSAAKHKPERGQTVTKPSDLAMETRLEVDGVKVASAHWIWCLVSVSAGRGADTTFTARHTCMRCSEMAHARPKPSYVEVPRPSSSMITSELLVAPCTGQLGNTLWMQVPYCRLTYTTELPADLLMSPRAGTIQITRGIFRMWCCFPEQADP